jgi:hypothetical protein
MKMLSGKLHAYSPRQPDSDSCGVHICAFAEAFIKFDGSIAHCENAWNEINVPFLRARIIHIFLKFREEQREFLRLSQVAAE